MKQTSEQTQTSSGYVILKVWLSLINCSDYDINKVQASVFLLIICALLCEVGLNFYLCKSFPCVLKIALVNVTSVSSAVFNLTSEVCRGDLFHEQMAFYVVVAVLVMTLSVLQRAVDCIKTDKISAFQGKSG